MHLYINIMFWRTQSKGLYQCSKCVVNNISPPLGSSKQLGCQPYDVYNTMVRNNLFVIIVFMNYRAYRKENNIGYFLDTILHFMHTFCIFWIRFWIRLYFSHLQHWWRSARKGHKINKADAILRRLSDLR